MNILRSKNMRMRTSRLHWFDLSVWSERRVCMGGMYSVFMCSLIVGRGIMDSLNFQQLLILITALVSVSSDAPCHVISSR